MTARPGFETSSYGSLHGGDIVLGEDGNEWGVEYVSRSYARVGGATGPEVNQVFTVALIRHGRRVVGHPSENTAVSVIHRADTALEAGAYQVLASAGLQPEVVSERWSPEWEVGS